MSDFLPSIYVCLDFKIVLQSLYVSMPDIKSVVYQDKIGQKMKMFLDWSNIVQFFKYHRFWLPNKSQPFPQLPHAILGRDKLITQRLGCGLTWQFACQPVGRPTWPEESQLGPGQEAAVTYDGL